MRYDILFHLVNGPEGDPVVYGNFSYERRAILFDLGDIHSLSARSLLKVTHVFVSHAHVDHFIGFDHLLRLHLGRSKTLRIYGPPGLTRHVNAKLSGYSWNLVHNYPYDFTLEVFEFGGSGAGASRFRCQDRFRPENLPTLGPAPVILDEPGLRVTSTLLEHDIPSLAYALEEKVHINVDKVRLEASGFAVGSWLRKAKEAVRREESNDAVLRVPLAAGPNGEFREITLGELRERFLSCSRGLKFGYVTDAAFNPENSRKIVELVRGADVFFCEAVFSERDRARAEQRRHLTAKQAGLLAREAEARRLVLFHFSPRYHLRLEPLYQEAAEAFGKEVG